jgi:hypothetical protein
MDSLPAAPATPPETPDETIRRLAAELDEAREQQAATTEILEIINRSPSDLAPVFKAIVGQVRRLRGADGGTLWTFDDGRFCRWWCPGWKRRHARYATRLDQLASKAPEWPWGHRGQPRLTKLRRPFRSAERSNG